MIKLLTLLVLLAAPVFATRQTPLYSDGTNAVAYNLDNEPFIDGSGYGITIHFSSNTWHQFPTFFNSQNGFAFSGEQLAQSASIYTGPQYAIFPSSVTSAQVLARDYSTAAEFDLVGCDPVLEPDCINYGTGGFAQHALLNAIPGYTLGQGANQNVTQYNLNLFGPVGKYLNYIMYMSTNPAEGVSWIPVDISTNATILNLATPQSELRLAPAQGTVSVGGSSTALYYCTGSTSGTFDGNLARGNSNTAACLGGTWVETKLKLD